MNREPWICPQCGRTLGVRNQEHVCGHYDFETHFVEKDPIGRAAYDWMCEVFHSLGPYDVLVMKTMIGFAQGVNLAFVRTKKLGVEISVVLARPVTSPRFTASVPYSRTKTIYRVVVQDEAGLDGELESWLREAYSRVEG